MKIGVLGTGMVGKALAGKLTELGHEVMMGARTAGNEAAAAWAGEAGGKASAGTFAEAAAHGEMVVLAVRGDVAPDAADMAGAKNLGGKVVIDVSNPLDMSQGMPPVLIAELSNTTSLGETLQARFPDAKVVKALNTVNASVMVTPERVAGPHDIFICGNDDAAKAEVSGLLKSFGWADPVDLGPIEAARGTEGMMPFWLRLWSTLGTSDFNYHIQGRG